MRGKSAILKRGGLTGGLISRSNNELREVSRSHSSEEVPVMGMERRAEQSISWSKSRIAEKTYICQMG